VKLIERRVADRRAQNAHVTWPRMLRIADARLPRVPIVHPWPSDWPSLCFGRTD